MSFSAVLVTFTLLVSTSAQSQQSVAVAKSSVGTAGQRQEPAQAAASIDPVGRLDTRISNRVQSRIRNRIDQSYDPQANATSPFKVAADSARTAMPHLN